MLEPNILSKSKQILVAFGQQQNDLVQKCVDSFDHGVLVGQKLQGQVQESQTQLVRRDRRQD